MGDFGIARLGTEDTITGTGQVLGTASYLAPERALGRPATDASDRYSLAVVAYELLVGERPFTSSHFAVQARQHVEEEPPAASSRNRALPPTVDAVLARGMAKRPEERWPSAHEFAQALEAALREPTARPIRAAAAAPAPTRPIRPVAAGGRTRCGGTARRPRATAPPADARTRRRRWRGIARRPWRRLAAGAIVASPWPGRSGAAADSRRTVRPPQRSDPS